LCQKNVIRTSTIIRKNIFKNQYSAYFSYLIFKLGSDFAFSGLHD